MDPKSPWGWLIHVAAWTTPCSWLQSSKQQMNAGAVLVFPKKEIMTTTL